mgnify:CR=1 FL=1
MKELESIQTSNFEYWPSGFGYDLLALVYIRPNFLDDALEYELDIGRPVLRRLFHEMEIDRGTISGVLIFPERWTNVIERRQLFQRVATYLPNLKRLTVKTHCPVLIGEIRPECIRMVDSNDASIDDINRPHTERLCSAGHALNLINPKCATVLHGQTY